MQTFFLNLHRGSDPGRFIACCSVQGEQQGVEQDGNVAAEFVEGIEVEGNPCAAGYCDEVDQTVRGAADGLQDNHGVAD